MSLDISLSQNKDGFIIKTKYNKQGVQRNNN
jgi:hypothetical protein